MHDREARAVKIPENAAKHSNETPLKLGGVAAPRKEKSRSYLGRGQTGMSGANVSPIGRNREA